MQTSIIIWRLFSTFSFLVQVSFNGQLGILIKVGSYSSFIICLCINDTRAERSQQPVAFIVKLYCAYVRK